MEHSASRVVGVLLACAAAFAPAHAQSVEEMRERIEARLNVAGTIDIEPDGRVSAHTVEDAADVPREVLALIERAAAGWRFEPVIEDGVAVPARSTMHLKVVAAQVPGSEAVRLRLGSAYFGKDATGSEYAGIRSERTRPPRYPAGALANGAGGAVYLVLRLDAEGRVADRHAERVDLFLAADGKRMATWREAFAQAALRAASGWRFALSGDAVEEARAGRLCVRVPVEFTVNEGRASKDGASRGAWQAYIPGPEQPAPWMDAPAAVSPDTFAGTGTFPVDAGHALLTPLDPPG